MISKDDIKYALALKELRKNEGNRTQEALAHDLGLENQRRLSEYELGKKPFGKEFIKKICSVFKITQAEFKNLAGKLSGDISLKAEILEQNKNIEDYQLKLLLHRKENVELLIENARLKHLLYEAQCKLKFLCPEGADRDIYVLV